MTTAAAYRSVNNMAKGLSPKLPFTTDEQDGHALNKTYPEMVLQNMKMILLTNPGERIMDPLFGVGMRRYLFEPNVQSTYGTIAATIKRQMKKYMPFVELHDIGFESSETEGYDAGLAPNFLKVKIVYTITPISYKDTLAVSVSND